MSTDLHDRTTNPSPEPKEPEKPKSSLSFAQVAGGALAAMTAAALGSRLSVAGTLVGAALASVVAAVAGSVYTSSLRRTHAGVKRVSAAWQGRGRAGAPAPAATSIATQGAVQPAQEPATGASAPSARRRIGWKPVLAGSVLMFAIAAVALTGIELATGQALSGGSGTTIGQVAERQTSPSPTMPRTPTPSTSVSSQPTATPSATPTVAPSAEPTPQPTATPSASTSPTATPSASASPVSTGAALGNDTTS